MNAPLEVPDDIRESNFYGCLTGAYEYEEEYLCSWILRIAKEFQTALEQSDLKEQPRVPELLAALRSTIDFLESIPEEPAISRKPISEAAGFDDLPELIPAERVGLYSYDREPSINELLDALREGNGVDDWALEELEKKGDKGRRALLSALKKEKNKRRLLTALELLIVIFKDDRTRTAVQRFVDASDDEIRHAAQAIHARVAQSENMRAEWRRRFRRDSIGP